MLRVQGYTYCHGDVQANVPLGMNANKKHCDGLLFLWTIINRTTARINATIAVIIGQLKHLEAVMTEASNDITTINTKVRRLLKLHFANMQVTFDE
jgi:hypothetical protein